MKILFISENYYPNISGIPVVVSYLAENLVKRNHTVGVLTRKMANAVSDDTINGVRVYRKNVYYGLAKNYCGDIQEYVQFIKDYDADVNIFEGASCITTDIVLPYLKEIKGKKLLHSHGFSRLLLKPFEMMSTFKNTIGNTYNWFRWKGYFKKTLPRYLNDFNSVFCLSEVDSSYEYLKKYFNNNVDVLGNAADDMFFTECINNPIGKYTKIQGSGYFVSVANYMAVKNQIGILKEFFISDSYNYDMVFIGSKKNYYYKALMSVYEKLTAQYGKRNIHFLTGVERADIPSIIKGASLYLVGSTAEGFSISIIECMAEGVPFISTSVGNARTLPGGVVIESICEMHKEINDLILNEENHKQLSKNGKEYAYQECRIDFATDRLLNIIANS